jgi:uncharacterized OsmC-like protein
MAQQQIVNGVDKDALTQTIKTFRKNPGLAQCSFRAKNTWVEGGHNRVTVKDFYAAGQEISSRKKPFEISADEPPVLLGSDRGANPVEYLLAALSACMTTSMVYHAAANGIQIDELESEFEGDLDLQGFLGLDANVRPGYQAIRATFRVKTDGTPEQLEKFTRFSPVFDVVSRSVPVVVRVEKK